MAEIRAGGHVIRNGSWVPAELADPVDESQPESEPEPELDAVDEYHVGGGWYEIDGDKYHGREAALEALEALEE